MRHHRSRLFLTTLEDRTVPAAVLASGAGPSGGPHGKVFDAAGATVASFFAYDPTFTGGVRVATGDITGDGVDDLVTAPGPGGGPHVRVFDGADLLNGVVRELRGFFAYAPTFTGGVNVAVADVTGDGFADIVTGAGAGGGPHIKVFDGVTGAEVRSFFAYDPSFAGGVSVAAGSVLNSFGRADIVTGAGPGGGPHVRVFGGFSGLLAREFMAYDGSFRGGVSVAVGHLTADSFADIVTGAGPSGGPHVRVFDGALGTVVREFLAYDVAFAGGVRVTTADLTGDGLSEVITAPGAGLAAQVRVFDGASGQARFGLTAYDGAFLGGASVGGLAPVNPAAAVTRSFDFRQGDAQGWQGGFADWPGNDPVFYELDSGIRPLPAELGAGTGFMLQGNNHSDDLFMFLKRQLTTADGVLPGRAYRVRFDITFGSNAPSGQSGVGGAPGEGVGLIAGAGAEEPQVVPVGGNLRMTVDKGNQNMGGRYASVRGHIANGQAPTPPPQPYVPVTRTGTHSFPARADAAGNLWLLVGTDSGFEGLTRLFYLNLTVTLIPLETVA